MRRQSRRVAATKSTIETAYLRILSEKENGKITVKEVCERANVNRTTFYKYYNDADFLAAVVRVNLLQDLENYLIETIPADHSDPYEFLSQIIMHIYRDDRAYFMPMLYHEPEFKKSVDDMLNKHYLIPRYGVHITEEEWIRIALCKFAVHGLLDAWIEEGMTIQPEKICNAVISFIKQARLK